jgi:eukaryotic-like serine/threonine-protein kinase
MASPQSLTLPVRRRAGVDGASGPDACRWRCSACGGVFRRAHPRCPADGERLTALTVDPLVGQPLGHRFVVEGLLAEGGMARIYRARSRCLLGRYAIKVPFGDYLVEPRWRRRFFLEAQAGSSVSHRNLVPVVDHGVGPAGPFLVMPLCDGLPLDRAIEQLGPLRRDQVVVLTRGILRGLRHLHGHGLAHCDVKPANVLVSLEDGELVPRLIDFGLTTALGGAPAAVGDEPAIGTAPYLAPELMVGRPASIESDLYALGIVALELLAGRPLGAGELAPAAILAAHPEPAAAPDRALAELLDRLIAAAPAARPASATEVLAALDQLTSLRTGPKTITWRDAP